MQLKRRLLGRRLSPEPQQAVAESVAEWIGRARDRSEVADPLLSIGIEQSDGRLRIAERTAVLDRVLQGRHAAGPIDVRQDRALLDDLAAERRRRLVVGPPIDEAQNRQVRKKREQ